MKLIVITLTPKPDKDSTKNQKTIPQNPLNIDAKIFNRILENKIQQHIKK